jgi:hypothetical protein
MAVRAAVAGEHLLVDLAGWDQVLSLKSRLRVPLSAIAGVEAKHRSQIQRLPGRWLRLPGTYVPSMVHHGSYGRRPHRDFWALFRQERVLVVHCRDWDYERVVLAVPDPDRVADELSRILL